MSFKKKSLFGQYVDKVLELSKIDGGRPVRKGNLVRAEFAIRISLPYCIVVDNLGNVTLKNREYQQLGSVLNVSKEDTEIFIGKTHEVHIGTHYLYYDDDKPWESVKNFKAYKHKLYEIIDNCFE